MMDIGDANLEDPSRTVPKSQYPAASGLGPDELFVRITCAFGELNHATYLPTWADANRKKASEIIETPHMERYLAFLEESEGEESSSDEDDLSSSCTSS